MCRYGRPARRRAPTRRVAHPAPPDGRLPRLRVHHYQTYTTKEEGTLRWPGGRHLCARCAIAGPRRRATHSSGKIGCGPFGYRR